MPATDRLLRERLFHDRQARDRAVTFAAAPGRLRFRDADYLDHEPWVRCAFARMGDVARQPVLDLGCGHGMAAVLLARRGAVVSACDLSAGYVAEARARARANEVDVRFVQADAHRLPFADETFAAVWGHAVLHHLDVPSAAREVRRVLRPGGVAVLCEPWAGHPLVRLARRWLRSAGDDHTPDEEPLGPGQVRELEAVFDQVQVEPYQVVASLSRIACFRRLARYVVITVRRTAKGFSGGTP